MRVVVDLPCENAECPVWNPRDNKLYWADIPAGKMYRYDPSKGSHELLHSAGQQIGALAVADDGAILQGLENGRIQIWKDGATNALVEGMPEEEGRRFNDCTVDPAGRLLIGTMPGGDLPARVYSVEPDGTYRVLLDDVVQSNGMAFSADGRTLYHVDTGRRTARCYRYDPETGVAEGDAVLITVEQPGVVPDGLTIDHQDRLWLALWGGSAVLCLEPDGKVVSRLESPCTNVSSVSFGGEYLDTLFITTAGGHERPKLGALAGSLFETKADSTGRPPSLFPKGRSHA